MANEKIRIRLKSYEHSILDESGAKIVDTAKRTGAEISGPVPLPTERTLFTVLRSPHKNKDSREQFEMRTHKRLIDILNPTPKTVDSLMTIVMGNEVKGVQQEVIDACDGCIEIPQYGTKHSLNVSVTTGIVLWEFANKLIKFRKE